MLGLLLCNLHEMTGFDMFDPFSMSRGVRAVDGAIARWVVQVSMS